MGRLLGHRVEVGTAEGLPEPAVNAICDASVAELLPAFEELEEGAVVAVVDVVDFLEMVRGERVEREVCGLEELLDLPGVSKDIFLGASDLECAGGLGWRDTERRRSNTDFDSERSQMHAVPGQNKRYQDWRRGRLTAAQG